MIQCPSVLNYYERCVELCQHAILINAKCFVIGLPNVLYHCQTSQLLTRQKSFDRHNGVCLEYEPSRGSQNTASLQAMGLQLLGGTYGAVWSKANYTPSQLCPGTRLLTLRFTAHASPTAIKNGPISICGCKPPPSGCGASGFYLDVLCNIDIAKTDDARSTSTRILT